MKPITGRQFDRLLVMQGSVCFLLGCFCLAIALFHRGFRKDVDKRIIGRQSIPIEMVQIILEEADVTPYIAVPCLSVGFIGTGWLLLLLRKKRRTLIETEMTEQQLRPDNS